MAREHHACWYLNLKAQMNTLMNVDHFTLASENTAKTDHPGEHAGAHAGDHRIKIDLPAVLKNPSEDPEWEILLQNWLDNNSLGT
jgi:hypothetical protein